VCRIGFGTNLITQAQDFLCRYVGGRLSAHHDAPDGFVALLLAFVSGYSFLKQLGNDGAPVPVGEGPVEALLDVVGNAEVHGAHDVLRLLKISTTILVLEKGMRKPVK
jgi:hypothetical protein